MDAMTRSVIFTGGAPFEVQGTSYTVKALPLRDIVNHTFSTSKLYCPREDEAPANWQALSLCDAAYRDALNLWMGRLLELDGEPQSLDAVGHWTLDDIGRFLSWVLVVSGLVRVADDGEHKPTEPEDWLDVVSELQYRAHMSWDELLDMPLLRLNAIRERVLKQAAQDAANSAAGALSGLVGGLPLTGTKSPQAGTQGGAASLLGDTPQFATREEYR